MIDEKNVAKAEVFQKIQYSQCLEDPNLHQIAFDLKPGQNIVAVASAGDNVFAHLLDDPGVVHAADFNAKQIYLVELKMAAIRQLDWEHCIRFLGERASEERWNTYRKIRDELSPDAQIFWDGQRQMIERGVIHAGNLEKYLSIFQKYVLPFVHTKKTCRAAFAKKSLPEQREFYEKKWDNIQGRILYNIFFGKFIMSRLGRSKEQFAHVKQTSIARQFIDRHELVFTELPAYDNPFLQYIFLGYHPHLDHLHPYLQEKNYLTIRSRLDRIKLYIDSIGGLLDQLESESVHAFNLSDIFEYISDDAFVDLGKKIHRVSAKGGIVSYWDFLVPRRLSASLPDLYSYNEALSRELWLKDRAFVYMDYIVDKAK